jgi:hypothetical protein
MPGPGGLRKDFASAESTSSAVSTSAATVNIGRRSVRTLNPPVDSQSRSTNENSLFSTCLRSLFCTPDRRSGKKQPTPGFEECSPLLKLPPRQSFATQGCSSTGAPPLGDFCGGNNPFGTHRRSPDAPAAPSASCLPWMRPSLLKPTECITAPGYLGILQGSRRILGFSPKETEPEWVMHSGSTPT